jgi:glucose-fructose oxidoreductase
MPGPTRPLLRSCLEIRRSSRPTLSRKYGTKHNYSYEQYADCLAGGEIDAVYITLPNHMHRAYTEAAAQAGIHILCEKPMALDEADCQAMIAEVERAKVKLMIAYRLHFERGNLHAVEYVNAGKLREAEVITSVFSQHAPIDSQDSRDFYTRANHASSPMHASGMLAV